MKCNTMLRSAAAAFVAVLLLAIPTAANTQNQNTEALLEQANKAATGSPTTALAIYELVLEQSAGNDPKAFGRTQGEYWKLITKLNDFPRAFNFFSRLAETHQSSPDVLGAEGAAIGGYMGWLYSTGTAQKVDDQFISALDVQARSAFETGLKLDPNNFACLFGYAIYETYRPGGMEHARQLFARLDTLRAAGPYYPWQYVDQVKKERLSGN
jgi:hypothetical protein